MADFKFLIDECVGDKVAQWLQQQGYDAISIFDTNRGIDDDSIWESAIAANNILVTNDKDFGALAFKQDGPKPLAVILLRLDREGALNKINVLSQLLDKHLDDLPHNFVVASERKIRINPL